MELELQYLRMRHEGAHLVKQRLDPIVHPSTHPNTRPHAQTQTHQLTPSITAHNTHSLTEILIYLLTIQNINEMELELQYRRMRHEAAHLVKQRLDTIVQLESKIRSAEQEQLVSAVETAVVNHFRSQKVCVCVSCLCVYSVVCACLCCAVTRRWRLQCVLVLFFLGVWAWCAHMMRRCGCSV